MKMKSTLKLVLLIGLSLIFFGCITQFSPTDDTITLVYGESQVFTAKNDIATATLVWELDGQQVATGGTYTLEAENPGPANLTQTLTVSEKGGNPLRRHDTVSWSITVQPPQDLDQDGYPDDIDCNDNNPAIHPGAVEICNKLDDNCDTQVDEGLTCSGPAAPINVQATDCDPVNYDPAHVNITITWDAVEEAEYYRVHRAIYAETNAYKMVAENVTGTSYEFVQTWEDDVLAIIGPTPGLSPTADFDNVMGPYPERLAFITALNDYRQMALPILMDFKAPAFFKVEACNAMGCSDLSDADAGSAEYTHTQQYSDLAQHVIPSWGYAQLVALADAPPGAMGLTWCGIDLCGSGGGIARGRVVPTSYVNIDVQYENFTETLVTAPGSYFVANGRLGGSIIPAMGVDGDFLLSGSFDLSMNGRPSIGLDMNAHIGAYASDGVTRVSEGVATITYKGLAYQFTLPIQPIDGISGHAAAAPSPVVPAQVIPHADWYASEVSLPLPAVKTSRCNRVWPEYSVPQCPVSIAP